MSISSQFSLIICLTLVEVLASGIAFLHLRTSFTLDGFFLEVDGSGGWSERSIWSEISWLPTESEFFFDDADGSGNCSEVSIANDGFWSLTESDDFLIGLTRLATFQDDDNVVCLVFFDSEESLVLVRVEAEIDYKM